MIIITRKQQANLDYGTFSKIIGSDPSKIVNTMKDKQKRELI